jgi:hypothetical protein
MKVVDGNAEVLTLVLGLHGFVFGKLGSRATAVPEIEGRCFKGATTNLGHWPWESVTLLERRIAVFLLGDLGAR